MQYLELQKFAKWFHQDFGVIFESVESGANEYLEALTEKQRISLSKEIGDFLKKYPGKDHKALKNAWLKLGAQWWSKEELIILFKMLSPK